MAIKPLYRFDGADLKTDYSSNSYNQSAATGTPTQVSGGFNKAVNFGGNSNFRVLSVPVAATTNKTISFLVKLAAEPANNSVTDYKYTFFRFNPEMAIAYQQRNNNYELIFRKDISNYYIVSGGLGTVKWHHITGTYTYNSSSSGYLNLYLDGKQVITNASVTTQTGDGDGYGTYFSLGSYWGNLPSTYVNGNMDEFYVDDTAYSAAKVKNLYAHYKGMF